MSFFHHKVEGPLRLLVVLVIALVLVFLAFYLGWQAREAFGEIPLFGNFTTF